MKTEIEERLQTVDEMLCAMILDTYIKMKMQQTGKDRIIIFRKANSLKPFFNNNVCWICYQTLDNRLKYSVDVLSDSDHYQNDSILFLD